MRSIELFTGTGGLALGLAHAGFRHELLIDKDRHTCATLRENGRRILPMTDWNLIEGDVASVDYAPHAGQIQLLAAGAPCQPFSLAGNHGGHNDERNMFPEVVRAVRELRPDAILIENVRGLLRPSFRPYFEYVLESLALPDIAGEPDEDWEDHQARISRSSKARGRRLRYDVHHHLLNAADFGVPQRRERVVIVAFRSDLGVAWSQPCRTHSQDALLYAQYVDGTYWREHELSAPEHVPARLSGRVRSLMARPQPVEWRWRTVRDALRFLPIPVDFREDPVFPNHFGNPGARSYKGHTGSHWDDPAKTLKAGVHAVPGGENMLRDDDGSVRYFTIREAARLQTFPDAFRLSGPWGECMRQLGNAVPVRMAATLGDLIRVKLARPRSGRMAKPRRA